MRSSTVAALLVLAAGAEAFAPVASNSRAALTRVNGYVPNGFTPAQWKEFQAKEKAKNQTKKNLGGLGPKGFKSRSFQSFQEALERGEAEHLLPVENAKERLRKGELKLEDIPYMQRGGSWDNSDVKGAKKVKWLNSDKEYASGGYKKEQSVSIFGKGAGLDWTGTQERQGPQISTGKAPAWNKGYKAPTVNDEPKKKFFGLF